MARIGRVAVRSYFRKTKTGHVVHVRRYNQQRSLMDQIMAATHPERPALAAQPGSYEGTDYPRGRTIPNQPVPKVNYKKVARVHKSAQKQIARSVERQQKLVAKQEPKHIKTVEKAGYEAIRPKKDRPEVEQAKAALKEAGYRLREAKATGAVKKVSEQKKPTAAEKKKVSARRLATKAATLRQTARKPVYMGRVKSGGRVSVVARNAQGKQIAKTDVTPPTRRNKVEGTGGSKRLHEELAKTKRDYKGFKPQHEKAHVSYPDGQDPEQKIALRQVKKILAKQNRTAEDLAIINGLMRTPVMRQLSSTDWKALTGVVQKANVKKRHRRTPSTLIDPATMPAGWNAKERDSLKKKMQGNWTDDDLAVLEDFYDRAPYAAKILRQFRVGIDDLSVAEEPGQEANALYTRPGSEEVPGVKGPALSVSAHVDQALGDSLVGSWFSQYDSDFSFQQAAEMHELGHHAFENSNDEVKESMLNGLASMWGVDDLDQEYKGVEEYVREALADYGVRKPTPDQFRHVLLETKANLLFADHPAAASRSMSEYGATNWHEFMAEAWAEYATNPDPRPLAAAIGQVLERVMTSGVKKKEEGARTHAPVPHPDTGGKSGPGRLAEVPARQGSWEPTPPEEVPEGPLNQRIDLDRDQLNALTDYTAAGYKWINAGLRGNRVPPDDQWTIDMLTDILRFSQTEEPITVYRGLAIDKALDVLKPGTVLEDKAFTSTSQSRLVAERFSEGQAGLHPAILVISLPAGTHALDVQAAYPGNLQQMMMNEQEMILPPHTKMEVTEARTVPGSTIMEVRARVVNDGFSDLPAVKRTPMSLGSLMPAQRITRDVLSNAGASRTREVSPEEFDRLYTVGRQKMERWRADSQPMVGLNRRWRSIKRQAWQETRSEWGGLTVNARTGEPVRNGQKKYALTMKPPGKKTISIPIDADQETLAQAMNEAKQFFADELKVRNAHLGVFRDEDSQRIDIDPVLVVDTLADVESVGSYTHAVGGAYSFQDGNGYWPPYVKENADAGLQGPGPVAQPSREGGAGGREEAQGAGGPVRREPERSGGDTARGGAAGVAPEGFFGEAQPKTKPVKTQYGETVDAAIADFLATKRATGQPTLDDLEAAHGVTATGTGRGTVDDPINCAGNVMLAARLLSEGKHVRLNHVDEVGTLLQELANMVEKAKSKGEKAPIFDLCKVSVPKTNLFCAQSKGIPRAQMPQLGGMPRPDSPADKLERDKKGEVDVTVPFIRELKRRGVKITERIVPAAYLKASQNELDGPKVAGMSKAMEAGKVPDAPIFVTKDGYIIDGHHRWASKVAIDVEDGHLGDINMPVRELDMEIGEALDFANAFTAEYGILPKGLGAAAEGVKNGEKPANVAGVGSGGVLASKTPKDPLPEVEFPKSVLDALQPGDKVYRHPQGATVIDRYGSVTKYSKTGVVNPKTSATSENLESGHGQWQRVANPVDSPLNPDAPKATKSKPDMEKGIVLGPSEPEAPSAPAPKGSPVRAPMSFDEAPLADVPKYIQDDDWYFQQKVDGIRAQLVIEPGKKPWFRSRSGGTLQNGSATKVSNKILNSLGEMPEGGPTYSVDGEILNGKWYVFDLTVDGQEKTPWEERMAVAENWASTIQGAGVDLVESLPTARTPEEKQKLYDTVYNNGGEGVMMKRKDAPYSYDRRVTHMLKAKFRSTADVIVVDKGRKGHESATLALFKDGKLVEVGSSSLLGKEKKEPINVGDVVEVQYLYAFPESENIVQPTILRKRPDKHPEQATMDQLRFTNKEVLDKERALGNDGSQLTPDNRLANMNPMEYAATDASGKPRYSAKEKKAIAAAQAKWNEDQDRLIAATPLDEYLAAVKQGDLPGRPNVLIAPTTEEELDWYRQRHAALVAQYGTDFQGPVAPVSEYKKQALAALQAAKGATLKSAKPSFVQDKAGRYRVMVDGVEVGKVKKAPGGYNTTGWEIIDPGEISKTSGWALRRSEAAERLIERAHEQGLLKSVMPQRPPGWSEEDRQRVVKKLEPPEPADMLPGDLGVIPDITEMDTEALQRFYDRVPVAAMGITKIYQAKSTEPTGGEAVTTTPNPFAPNEDGITIRMDPHSLDTTEAEDIIARYPGRMAKYGHEYPLREAILTHEFGHVATMSLDQQAMDDLAMLIAEDLNFDLPEEHEFELVLEDFMRDYPDLTDEQAAYMSHDGYRQYLFAINRARAAKAISEYGATSWREFVAEAYAEYVLNPEARPLTRKIGEFIEKTANEPGRWKVYGKPATGDSGPVQEDRGGGVQAERLRATSQAAVSTGGQEEVADVSDWKRVGHQKGSNPGGFFNDPKGVKWYLKFPDESHVRNEYAANLFYHEAGIKVPEVKVLRKGNKPVLASRVEEGLTDSTPRHTQFKEAAYDGFAVDAWLANWDAVGLEFDNLVADKDGNPFRIDAGGSLLYRAMGSPKGAAFGPEAKEIDTLRDGTSAQTTAVYHRITDEDIKASIEKHIAPITPERIREIVEQSGMDPVEGNRVEKMLIARRQWLMDRFGVKEVRAREQRQKDLTKVTEKGRSRLDLAAEALRLLAT